MSEPFTPTVLLRRHAQTIRDSTSSYKIDYVIMIKNFLNPEGHQSPFSGAKVTAILLKGWVWLIGGVASGRVCACSLQSRIVFFFFLILIQTLRIQEVLAQKDLNLVFCKIFTYLPLVQNWAR